MSVARNMRASLCDRLSEVGALAPTACEGWQAQDLAAHLWIRERRLSALPGIGMERFADRTAQVQNAELHRNGFDTLVSDLRRPAGIMGLFDPVANAAEFTIHLLDVARPNDLDPGISAEDEDKVMGSVSMFARMVARRFDGRIVLRPTRREPKSLGRGSRTVHLDGLPSDLLFYLAGRTAHARVEVTVEPDAVARMEEAVVGL